MNIFDFASMLNQRSYGNEITAAEEKAAKELGYVIIFGYSDDCAEFRGAIDDEFGCFDGGRVYTKKNWYIDALWCKNDFTWSYDTNILHATFNIFDGDEKYCQGIVFDIKEIETREIIMPVRFGQWMWDISGKFPNSFRVDAIDEENFLYFTESAWVETSMVFVNRFPISEFGKTIIVQNVKQDFKFATNLINKRKDKNAK